MRRTILSTLLAVGMTSAAALPALADRSCSDATRKLEEASALRHQAREEARFGDHDRFCDTLDEVSDRFDDAKDDFEDCGNGVAAIDMRGELRALRVVKRENRCD